MSRVGSQQLVKLATLLVTCDSTIAVDVVERSVHTAHCGVGRCHVSDTSLKFVCVMHAMLTSLLLRMSMFCSCSFSKFLFAFFMAGSMLLWGSDSRWPIY